MEYGLGPNEVPLGENPMDTIHRYRKEQIPDSSCSLIDLPLTAKRENAGALGHWPKKKIAYLFPYKFANFENQNLLA